MAALKKKTPWEQEWQNLSKKEEKFVARREEGPTSVLVKKLDRFIPEKLSGTLNAAFFKGFQVIFEKGTGIIEKTYNKDKKEAEEYISNPVLWNRILEISSALLSIDSSDPYEVMGYPDNRKLKSSMTLFYEVSGNEIFKKVLDKFYNGEEDGFTLEKLNK